MSFFKKLFGKKEEPEPEVIKRKDPTQFLKEVHVTSIKYEHKPAKTHKIMIFEDSATWAAVIKAALEKESFDVLVHSNAMNAIEDVLQYKPALILMDVNMPQVSGHEATKAIKTKQKLKDIPIIILTSGTSPKERMEAMMAGARTILTKDQPLEDIVSSIKAYMENTALKTNVNEYLGRNPLQ